MKLTVKSLIGGGAKLLLPLLLINSAFADSTSDARIQAYKANKLIPQNIVLPTSTGAADSDEVVLFNKGALSWSSTTALSASYAPLLEKYGDMTIDELRAAMGPAGTFDYDMWEWTEEGWLSDVTPEQQEIREYLSLVANNKLQSDKLTSSEALSYLQEQFDLFANESNEWATLGAFPCEGLDFSGRDLMYTILRDCTGITASQILSAGVISYSELPSITFTGDESFAGVDLGYTNLSLCSGITGAQLMSADFIGGAILPAVVFKGNESFAGKYLSSTDFRNCTGITAEQIGTASEIDYINITSTQYNEWKQTLQSKFSGVTIYVDNEEVTIP